MLTPAARKLHSSLKCKYFMEWKYVFIVDDFFFILKECFKWSGSVWGTPVRHSPSMARQVHGERDGDWSVSETQDVSPGWACAWGGKVVGSCRSALLRQCWGRDCWPLWGWDGVLGYGQGWGSPGSGPEQAGLVIPSGPWQYESSFKNMSALSAQADSL